MKRLDLVSQRFGSLLVTEAHGLNPRGASLWLCRCDCGQNHVANGAELRRGKTTSCGCMARMRVSAARKTHGLTKTPTWKSWESMIARCGNPNNIGYANYGGRGISVCERWLSFENFVADMGMRPRGMSLDRLDSNKDYEPGNCKWSTTLEQNRNKRSTRLSMAKAAEIRRRNESDGVLAREFGVSRSMIQRVRAGKAWRADAEAA